MEDKLLVALMARSYRKSKIFLAEYARGFRNCSDSELNTHRYIVDHIDLIVQYLNDRDRFIIQHEVILGKTGKWYRDQLSVPSYYRHRKEAYRTFIKFLDTQYGYDAQRNRRQ